MKRRIDEHPKPENSSRSHINNTLSGFPRVHITHPTSGTAIVSPYQGPTDVGSSGKVDGGMQSSVHHIPLQSFTTAMPAAAQTPINQGLQGGAANLASLHIAGKPRVPTAAVSPGPAAAATLSQVATTGTTQQFQRLKVEDALSYLDQVKFKFGSQPQVYNNFLDIMKEFKSQSIDTPGVIERVSTLFRGHSELIVGFNTFLPPGYKIEVQNVDGQGAVTPSGTQTQTVVHTPTGILTHSAQSIIPLTTVGTTPTTQTHLIPQPSPKQTMHAFTASVTQAAVNLNTAVQHSYHQAPPIPTSTSPRPVAPSPQSSNPAPLPTATNPQSQPVEFNHAINYVNKIKNRFQGQPDVYKQFLEILHTYQKEQRVLKESAPGTSPVHSQPPDGPGHPKSLSEAEVYSQVARLFQHQTDLLQEFGQFLPDATNATNGSFFGFTLGEGQTDLLQEFDQFLPDATNAANGNPLLFNFQATKVISNDHTSAAKKPLGLKLPMPTFNNNNNSSSNNNNNNNNSNSNNKINPMKRPPPTPPPATAAPPNTTPPAPSHPPAKRPRMGTLKDVTLAEAGKFGTLNEFAFFDKVRKALRGGVHYENFLRCLQLYNQEIVSRMEVVQLVSPFLVKFPELLKWFKDFVGYREGVKTEPGIEQEAIVTPTPPRGPPPAVTQFEPIPNSIVKQGRVSGDLAMEIDYSTCKRLGASYCALPKTHAHPKCSGRTPLCREVLNDTWVSFPSWSEDSTFVSSRKTQYEEYIYRCEDERFELDVVIELNAATIRILDGAQKKVQRMAPEDASRYRLDDSFGGSSSMLYQRAIKRIYGEKTADIIEGLKKNPQLAIPIVLKRLRAKEDEWREAQKSFNKIWREQNEKYYLKSLDHQGINFKQNDIKNLRSKALLHEIETAFDERHDQIENGARGVGCLEGPHLSFEYKDRAVFDDAANLLIHHVKRQPGIQSQDKTRVKQLLRHTLPDLFHHPRQELSDDERDDVEDEEEEIIKKEDGRKDEWQKKMEDKGGGGLPLINGDIGDTEYSVYPGMSEDPDEQYSFFMTNTHWYSFLRLHHILCERLTKIYHHSQQLMKEEDEDTHYRNSCTATALRLRPKRDLEVRDYYKGFVNMVKDVLDGQLDTSSYEETLRELFGIHAYTAFTIDKVISNAVRQLQNLVTDETSVQVTDLRLSACKKGAAGGACGTTHQRHFQEQQYQRHVETLLQDYAFKVYIYKKSWKMTIQLVDSESSDSSETGHPSQDRWSSYVEQYASTHRSEMTSEVRNALVQKAVPVFLFRTLSYVRAKKESSDSKKGSPVWDMEDSLTSHFNYDSYRMTWSANRDDKFYKRGCLTNAKNSHQCVTVRLKSRFSNWHNSWLKSNTTDSSAKQCSDWFLGRIEGLMPNRTKAFQDNDSKKTPYYLYNRYRVGSLDPS